MYVKYNFKMIMKEAEVTSYREPKHMVNDSEKFRKQLL